MKDPERLLHGEDLSARLLASASADAPSPPSRAQAARALGLSVGVATITAPTAASGAAAATAKASGAALWVKLVVGGVVTGALAAGAFAVVHERPIAATLVTAPSNPPAHDTVTRTPATLPRESSSSAQSPVPSAMPIPRPIDAVRTNSAPQTRARSSKAPGDSALARELSMLDDASKALSRGNAIEALAAVDRYDRAFPNGVLKTEAAVVQIEALLASGDATSARSLARRLLAADPLGPHAQRLRTIVGDDEK